MGRITRVAPDYRSQDRSALPDPLSLQELAGPIRTIFKPSLPQEAPVETTSSSTGPVTQASRARMLRDVPHPDLRSTGDQFLPCVSQRVSVAAIKHHSAAQLHLGS